MNPLAARNAGRSIDYLAEVGITGFSTDSQAGRLQAQIKLMSCTASGAAIGTVVGAGIGAVGGASGVAAGAAAVAAIGGFVGAVLV